MRFERLSLMASGALTLLAGSAAASEPFAKGLAVAREVAASDGSRFLVTVKPPADRGVDPRIFSAFELSAGKATDKSAALRSREEAAAAAESLEEQAIKLTQTVGIFKVLGGANLAVQTGKPRQIAAPVVRPVSTKVMEASQAKLGHVEDEWEEF